MRDMGFYRAMGKRLRSRRLGLRLSVAEVARGIGVTPSQVYRYESGACVVRASRLGDIASGYRCHVAYPLGLATAGGRRQRGRPWRR